MALYIQNYYPSMKTREQLIQAVSNHFDEKYKEHLLPVLQTDEWRKRQKTGFAHDVLQQKVMHQTTNVLLSPGYSISLLKR